MSSIIKGKLIKVSDNPATWLEFKKDATQEYINERVKSFKEREAQKKKDIYDSFENERKTRHPGPKYCNTVVEEVSLSSIIRNTRRNF